MALPNYISVILMFALIYLSCSHVSYSIDLPSLLQTSVRKDCTEEAGCPSGFVCNNAGGARCQSPEDVCSCISNSVACNPREKCASGYNCISVERGGDCHFTSEVCTCVRNTIACTVHEPCASGMNCVSIDDGACRGVHDTCVCSPKTALCNYQEGCVPGLSCIEFNGDDCDYEDSLCACLSRHTPCGVDSDCSLSESCVYFSGQLCNSTTVRSECSCVPKSTICFGPGYCKHGDICVAKNDRSSSGFCVSCNGFEQHPPVIEPLNGDTCNTSDSSFSMDGGVCVDANLLKHLPATKLVFKTHRRANVLCDASGSCATSGHIVVYLGQAMMMVSYCKIVGQCSRRTMYVNSPRMTRRLRVSTKTLDLHFSALSSRWQTPFEERLLSTLIRFAL